MGGNQSLLSCSQEKRLRWVAPCLLVRFPRWLRPRGSVTWAHVLWSSADPALPSCPESTVRGLCGFIPDKSRGEVYPPRNLDFFLRFTFFFWHKILDFKILHLAFHP